MKSGNIVTVLDIGSTKVCCCIASVFADGKFSILGIGYCQCVGVKSGVIVDMESVEKSMVRAIESAENAANCRVKSVYVSISGKNVKSKIVNVSTKISGKIVTNDDINKMLGALEAHSEEVEIVHAIPITFNIDSSYGITDPVGMVGSQLSMSINLVTAPRGQLNNLLVCVAKYHLKPIGVAAAGYASGLCMNSGDRTLSTEIIVDFGGGTTSIAFFYDGVLCGCETIPLGGQHITKDIALGLGISIGSAERVKTLHGSAFASVEDISDMVLVPVVEGDNIVDLQQVSKSALNNIIQSRAEEILCAIREKISSSIFKKDFAKSPLVITGGGSQLPGIRELTVDILARKVSLKKLSSVQVNSDIVVENDFATAFGIVKFAQMSDASSLTRAAKLKSSEKNNIFKKALLWIENNL